MLLIIPAAQNLSGTVQAAFHKFDASVSVLQGSREEETLYSVSFIVRSLDALSKRSIMALGGCFCGRRHYRVVACLSGVSLPSQRANKYQFRSKVASFTVIL